MVILEVIAEGCGYGVELVVGEAEELGLKRRRYPVVMLCGST